MHLKRITFDGLARAGEIIAANYVIRVNAAEDDDIEFFRSAGTH
jgi:hypothetical protein